MNAKIIYNPSEWGKRFHALTALGINEALGAGSAGPGKTEVLLNDATDQVTIEHQRCQNERHMHHLDWGASTGHALHLRRTRLMLEQTITRSHKLFKALDPGAQWNEQKSTWTLSSGYKYQFGHCKDPNDWEGYASFEFCVAKDTPVLMGDGSWKSIQNVQVGDMVATLEGAREVQATWAPGIKPCVRVVTSFQGEIVGTQLHPTNHPVLLWSGDESRSQGFLCKPQSGCRARPSGLLWQDYESLLGELPESAVRRVSSITSQNGYEASGGERLELSQLPAYCVPVALFAPLLRSAGDCSTSSSEYRGAQESCEVLPCSHLGPARQPYGPPDGLPRAGAMPPLGQDHSEGSSCGDSADARIGSGKPRDSRGRCSVCSHLRDGQLRRAASVAPGNVPLQAGAEGHAPTSFALGDRAGIPTGTSPAKPGYPHFYTGRLRSQTEEVRKGTVEIAFAGFFETFDLTVAGANHYITSSGLVNAQTAIYYDELVQFLEEQYDQINTRLRSSDPVLMHMLKIRSMSNPLMRREDGETFVIRNPHWVRDRFVKAAPEGNVVFKKKLTREDGTWEWHKWVYMPARLHDNPNKEFVRQYELNLLKKPAHIRAALLRGDWFQTVGSFFSEYWNKDLHVCRPFKIPVEWRVFRAMDWGFKAPGCLHWFALDDEDTLFCFKEIRFQGKLDAEVAEIVRATEIELDLWDEHRDESRITGVADTQLWEQRGDSGKNKAEVFREKGVPWRPADKKSRQTNAGHVIKRLEAHDYGTKTPGIVFFESCTWIIGVLPSMQTSQHNSEEPADGGDDHPYDSTAYGCAFASKGKAGIPPRREPKDEWEEEDAKVNTGRRGRHGYGQELC